MHSNHATIFTGERSELANDFMFEIWWCDGIDGALVFDNGKFTPDDNGTDTTKLTDVAGWCTLSELFQKQKKNSILNFFFFNRNESDFLTKTRHLFGLSIYLRFVLQYSVVYFQQLRVDFVQTLAQHIFAEKI